MNTHKLIIPLLLATTGSLAMAAADEPEATPHSIAVYHMAQGGGTSGTNFAVAPHAITVDMDDAPKPQMAPATFLGVVTQPARGALSSQLNLGEGVGLVVVSVIPESPAAGVLQRHDVLVKLDDQLLVEPRQIAVLIRLRKPGEEISLTVRRGGKEQVVKVKLGQRDLPPLADASDEAMPGLPGGNQSWGTNLKVLKQLGQNWPNNDARIIVQRNEAGGHRTVVDTSTSNIVFSDDRGTLELTTANGDRHLLAKGKDDKVIFDGPVNSPEDRAKLPDDVRQRLEKLDQSEGPVVPSTGMPAETRLRVLNPPSQPQALWEDRGEDTSADGSAS